MKIRNLTAALAAACFLTACGGGGDDDAPTGVSVPQGVRTVSASASADINSSNYASFSGPLARAVMHAAEGNSAAVADGRESLAVAGIARSALRAVAPNRERALAVTNSTAACTYGGSISVTFDDADNNQQVSRGDVLTVALSGCVEESGGAPGNGSMTMTINAIELNAAGDATAMDVSVSVSGFAEDGWGGMSGSFRLWMKEETATSVRMRVSYQAVTVADGNTTIVYDFDEYGVFSDTGGSFDLQGGLRIGGQTYAVVGADVFSHSSGSNPSFGTVSLRDAAGDQLVLRARSSTTVDLEFYAAGATAPSATLSGVTWTSLR